MSKHLIFFAILILNSPFSIRGEDSNEDETVEQKLEKFRSLVSALSYGDSCDYSAHNLMGALNKQIELLGTNRTLQQRIAFIQYVLEVEKPFCDADNMFVCDKETAKCTCGTSRVLQQGQKPPVIVADVDSTTGRVVCRYGRGNYCTYVTAEDRQKGGDFVDCVEGSGCKDAEEGSDCSVASFARYLILNGAPSKEQTKNDYFAGKICTCQKNSGNFRRNKRSPKPNSSVSRETAEKMASMVKW